MKTDLPTPRERLLPLIRTRQIREYASDSIGADELFALTEAARWSGSSNNEQPWRFVVVTDSSVIERLAGAYMPSSRALQTAPAAIAIAIPNEPGKAVMRAYDEGRASERILVGASMLGLGAAISWVWPDARPPVHEILGIPDGWLVRTIVAVGHPTEAAREPKSAPGTARRPREETVYQGRWADRP